MIASHGRLRKSRHTCRAFGLSAGESLMKNPWSAGLMLAVVVGLAGCSKSDESADNKPAAQKLFSDESAPEGEFSERDLAKRHKFVKIREEAMVGLAGDSTRVKLELLDGKEYTVLVKSRLAMEDITVATGALEEEPESKVVLSTALGEAGDRKVSGTITMADGRVYQISPTPDGHCLLELDPESVNTVCKPAEVGGQPATFKGENGETIQIAQQLASTNTSPAPAAKKSGGAMRRSLRGRRLFSFPASTPPGATRPSTSNTGRPLTPNAGRPSTTPGSGGNGGVLPPALSPVINGPIPGAPTKPVAVVPVTPPTPTPNPPAPPKTTPTPPTPPAPPKTTPAPPAPTPPAPTPPAPKPTPSAPPAGGSATIDVLVFYTSPAASARGGDAGIKSHIGAAIGNANSAFSSSGVGITLRLAGTALLAGYNSNGSLQGALEKVRTDDTVKAARDAKKADLVVLVMSGNSGGSAGLGAVMPNEKGTPSAAFSTVHEKFAISNYSFVHEIGHNLGAMHCWDQTGKGVHAYSHGHRWTGSDGKKYRSIMSYAKSGDQRVGYFSNPKISHKGQPTGDATKADNAKTFGVTGPVVSGYK
ncbi:MAG: hypothetical protein CMO74_08200 [Verrucomicrobiales bacterium]|nr:hypothetical protein [Verrucomicrobiales bacterium]